MVHVTDAILSRSRGMTQDRTVQVRSNVLMTVIWAVDSHILHKWCVLVFAFSGLTLFVGSRNIIWPVKN